jgi:hypothetical protein
MVTPLVKPRARRRALRRACAVLPGFAWRSLAALSVLFALAWSGSAALAYIPPVDDLWARLAEGVPRIKSAIVETETEVYDPEAPLPAAAAPGQPAPGPVPLKDRGFRQRLYWQRGTILAVETLAADGTPVHLLLQNGYRTYARALSSKAVFSEADLRPLLFPFLEGSATAWRDELVFWGIQPLSVDLVLSDTKAYLRLGEGAEPSLWIDRQTDLPVKLETQVAGGVPLKLELRFSDFMPVAPKNADAANPRLPKVVSYRVNGRLFRKSTVVEVQADAPLRAFPVVRWRQDLGIPETAPAFSFAPAEVRP